MTYIPNVENFNNYVWADVRDKMRNLVYQGENMTATLTEVIPGHVPGPHAHTYEQLVLILQGECDFFVDGIPYHLGPGSIMDIPGNVEHYIVATGNSPVLNLDIFTPRRLDRRESKIAKAPETRAAIKLFDCQA